MYDLLSSLLSCYIVQENQRNTLIKDTMREQCVVALAESWYQIMVSTCTHTRRSPLMLLCASGNI